MCMNNVCIMKAYIMLLTKCIYSTYMGELVSLLASAYKLVSVGLPLCWKAFLEINIPHQLH